MMRILNETVMKSTKTCFSFRAQKDMEGRMGVRFVDKRVIAGLAGAQAIEGKAAVCDPTRRRGRLGGRSRNRRNHHRFLKAASAPATKLRPSPPRRTRHFELYA